MAQKGNFVYSTDPEFEKKRQEENPFAALQSKKPASQDLRVGLEKKGRGGKTVTLVKGFEGSEEDLKKLGKQLKNACGTGGSAKEGEIIIQGDQRDKVVEALRKAGYGAKKSGH